MKRMILECSPMRTCGFDRWILQATETDIFVNGLSHCVRMPNIKELWVQKVKKPIPNHRFAAALRWK